MHKSIKLILVISFIFAGLIGNSTFLTSCKKKSRNKPNILLITMDALRSDHLSCYGYKKPTSPNIDNLARQGYLFENAVAHSSVTPISFASLFTSLYPSFNGAIPPRNMVLEASNYTLAEVLKDNGYFTIARTMNPWLSKDFGFDQGFEDFSVKGDWKSAIESIKTKSGQPFFLWVHMMEPHLGFVNHPGFTEVVSPSYDGSITSLDVYEALELSIKGANVSDEKLEQIVALYDGMIRWGDKKVNDILVTVEKEGLSDNTVIIFTSDHGEELKDHGGMSHGFHLYREVIHVPLIIKLPGKVKTQLGLSDTRRIKSIVGHVDIMPTIMDLIGYKIPSTVHGRSLIPEISGKENNSTEEKVYLSELHMAFGYHHFSLMSDRYHFLLSASYGKHEEDPYGFFLYWFKLLKSTDTKNPTKFVRKSGLWKERVDEALKGKWSFDSPENLIMLFDIKEDPEEKKNLAEKKPEVVKEFMDHLKKLKDKMPELKALPRPELDKEQEEQLRSIGYLR